jgi:hypothetical protein
MWKAVVQVVQDVLMGPEDRRPLFYVETCGLERPQEDAILSRRFRLIRSTAKTVFRLRAPPPMPSGV